jgi:hypothetical protein
LEPVKKRRFGQRIAAAPFLSSLTKCRCASRENFPRSSSSRRLRARLFGLRRRCGRTTLLDFAAKGERAAIAALTFHGVRSRRSDGAVRRIYFRGFLPE